MISTIQFEHGNETCAIAPGKFCRWQGVMGFGTKPVCMLFSNDPLHEKDDWIQRSPRCKEEFKESSDEHGVLTSSA